MTLVPERGILPGETGRERSGSGSAVFVKVGSASEVPAGERRLFDVEGTPIAVFNVGGTLHAIHNVCPHMGGPLVQGELEGTVVSCPWHSWPFELSTGERPGAPSCRVPAYAVKAEGEALLISVDPADRRP